MILGISGEYVLCRIERTDFKGILGPRYVKPSLVSLSQPEIRPERADEPDPEGKSFGLHVSDFILENRFHSKCHSEEQQDEGGFHPRNHSSEQCWHELTAGGNALEHRLYARCGIDGIVFLVPTLIELIRHLLVEPSCGIDIIRLTTNHPFSNRQSRYARQ